MESPRPEYSSTDQQEITTINYSPCDMLTAKYGEQTIMICKPNIKDITETLIAESQESIAFWLVAHLDLMMMYEKMLRIKWGIVKVELISFGVL